MASIQKQGTCVYHRLTTSSGGGPVCIARLGRQMCGSPAIYSVEGRHPTRQGGFYPVCSDHLQEGCAYMEKKYDAPPTTYSS